MLRQDGAYRLTKEQLRFLNSEDYRNLHNGADAHYRVTLYYPSKDYRVRWMSQREYDAIFPPSLPEGLI